jgi:Fic family protein
LVATGVFVTLLVDQPLTLMQTIENDQNVKNSDRAVAKVLLTAFDSGLGGTKLSNAEISVRTGLSTSTVRTSLKHLIAAGCFRSITPSKRRGEIQTIP